MEAAGLPITHNIRLALLHAYAEAGRMGPTRTWFDEVVASGRPADEYAFAALANCFRCTPPKFLPADAPDQLLALLERFREARAAADVEAAAAAELAYGAGEEEGEQAWGTEGGGGGGRQGGGGRGAYSPLLVVVNSVLNALVELG